MQVELVSRSQKAQSSVEKEAEVRNCHFLQAETARRKAASCEAAAYVSQGQVPIGTAPGSSLVKIPRTEGAQYSVASFAGSVIQGDGIPGLRSLRSLTWGYFLPPLRAR